MDLEKSCKQGRIPVNDFCELLGMRPMRTHLLDTGDYVILTILTCVSEEYINGQKALALEKITSLDSPEKGDFMTDKGTTAPINGNVFIKIQKKRYPEYLLIEGDRVGEANCPIPVYDFVNKYMQSKLIRH